MPGSELFGKEEQKEVMDVLETGILFRYNHEKERKGVWKARTFEKEFADYYDVSYCHMCSSGTTADDITLAACGVGYGDEVIVAPFTYIAPVESILKMGATPVFAEIDETLCLSAKSIEAVITAKTKAVMLVHMCGAMAKIDEIVAVCKAHELLLIEDAAQAIGATYKGKLLGTFGDIGCFSFDFFKTITAGEGGAIITNSEDLYNKAHMYSDHGHDHVGDNRGAEQHPILGTNYRISELHAAVALAQFRKLDYMLEKQRKHKTFIREALSKVPGVTFREVPDIGGDSATFLSFFLPDEKTTRNFIAACAEKNTGGVIYWYDNNFHYFKNWEHLKKLSSTYQLPAMEAGAAQNYKHLNLPQSDALMSRLACILIKINWTEEVLETYATQLVEALKESLKVRL